jgi:hypothetical protein
VKQEAKTIIKRQTLYVLLTILSVLVITFAVSFWICTRAIKAETHARYVGIMNVASEKIAKTVRGMEMNAMNEFDEVEKHLDSPESVIAALESKASLNPEVRGYFAAFEPDYFPHKGTWFEPYVVHVDSSAFEVRQVGSARHNYHKSDWYIRAKKSNESFWSDPYYYYDGTNISGHYTTFVKPVYDKTGRLACICGADMTFEWLTKELQRIDEENKKNDLLNKFLMYDTDFYTVVINSDGSCIAHPEKNSVPMTEEFLKRDLEQGKSGVVDMEVNGEQATVYYRPIEHVNWSVAVVTKQDIQEPLIKLGIIFLLLTIIALVIVGLVCRRIGNVEKV